MEPLLERCREMLAIAQSTIDHGIAALLEERKIIVERKNGDEAIYLTPLHIAVAGAAELLRNIRCSLKLLPPIDMQKAERWIERRHGIQLSSGQREAFILVNPVTGLATVHTGLENFLPTYRRR